MNNLHRELAPVSDAAWADLEAEARRTFQRNVAARRLVDVPEPAGVKLAALSTGHLDTIQPPADGVFADLRRAQPLVQLRVPFSVSRAQVDSVEQGAKDADWGPVKEAARRLALSEDRAVFEGYGAAAIRGIRAESSNAPLALPAQAREYPEVVSRAVSSLRLAGVEGPYALAMSADAFTTVSEASDNGYPIHDHLRQVVGGEIVWAPAIDGAFLLTTRGGDFELGIGQDVSVGYLSHDSAEVELYLQESFTFLVFTAEAGVALVSGHQ
ncbi:bacteriocin family protein [Streptomyces sp. HNM0575]|uniref:family 1 encapsulin nanocompartment shell protein n=1 Tax=Streptomyces sp. HNM0575 TaxID=2716338 RepID=UPI00145EBE10|nr:family 1 encapsulin nanocompartment shell protein [Streptomyces sp. HNM0575]NLU75337.1 bacteriocin family protein [Streptomyces sp. HNM0575]